ncbi:MAG: DUF2993 domain-containing protein [Limnochordaceae bacterium]|uniref:DUF2993 domain-containing protein n=1 Tax=Carboxydichorda subterranea TaxID=3109565 RepID=A0ABZ1BZ83_9FIRM|nr:DUF2993 domain-containing protein [Limnochorda sp. L945t]MBE3598733.1 DUF2993 domain-containing protein [Limnochordaceae bacterium]WRP17999.1 DUF2993 domain-containing protein [Limnochorda sp. L945t]
MPRRRGPGLLVAAGAAAILLGAAAVGVLAWSSGLPRSAEQRIRDALLSSLDGAGSLEVRLETRPGYRVLAGQIDHLEISGTALRAGELVADRFSLVGDALQLDMGKLAGGGGLSVSRARRLDMEMVVSEESVNRYLQATYELARLLHVQLLPQGPRLLMDAQLQDQAVRISLDSKLQVEPGNVVAVVPDRLAIEREGAQALALSLAGADSPLRIEIGQLPVPVAIDRVTVGEGELHLFASYRPPS